MKETEAEIGPFVEEWSDLLDLAANDCLYLKDVQDWAGQTEDRRVKGKSLVRIKEELKNKGLTVAGLAVEKWEIPVKRWCRHLWSYPVIFHNGEVTVCCRDMYGLLTIGNIRKKSIKEVWQSNEYQRFRQMDLEGNLPSLCQNCQDWYKAR
ncbi:SPASM domain-containing protein [bacterium]|nr:SPASM domain-containing protein [bacterium]